MVGFQIYIKGRADKICRLADRFFIRCEENEARHDFRSKQWVVSYHLEGSMEGSSQEEKLGEA